MICHNCRSEAGACEVANFISFCPSAQSDRKTSLPCRGKPIFNGYSTLLLWAWSFMRTPELERSVLIRIYITHTQGERDLSTNNVGLLTTMALII